MTDRERTAASPAATLARRAVGTTVLWAVYLRTRPTRSTRRAPVRLRSAAAALVSAAGPALAVHGVTRRRRVRLVAPASWSARAQLVGRLLVGVAAEEVLWRGPLVRCPVGPRRTVLAAASMTGFVGAHLRRDGLVSARVHVPNTVGWTAAVLVDGRLRTAALSHFAYNVVAATLRAVDTDGRVCR